jgi:hypothetical protein
VTDVSARPARPARPDPPDLPDLPDLAALVFLAGLTLVFTWPLAAHLTGGTIGAPADNLNFVWDFWWVRYALRTHASIFWTPDIFAPVGTSLATHTLVPILAVPAAWLLPAVSPLTVYNGALILSTFLNFACAYAAASAITRDRLASIFAAITFGGAPFLSVRLLGHLNVLSAWGLPLTVLAAHRYVRGPTMSRIVLLAAVLGGVAYSDYYYFIFAILIVAMMLLQAQWDLMVRRRPLSSARRRVLVVLVGLSAITSALILWTTVTGGSEFVLAGIRVRLTDSFNLRVETGLLVSFALLAWCWPAMTVSRVNAAGDSRLWRLLPIGAGVLAVLLIPLVIAAVQLWRGGDYSSQAYVWRNAPPGIDLATMILGNQLNPLTGAWTTRLFERFGINRMEGAGWLGIAPTLLLIAAIVRLRSRREIRGYLWIAGLFFVWSLGPYLRMLGYNTGAMLPQTALRFLPIIANARIPGRAFIVVQLMTALIAAVALTSLRESPRGRGAGMIALAIGVVLIDYWPVPRPWETVEAPSFYAALKNLPDGVVLEVPLGLRDGFGSRGDIDHRILYFQTIHEHPQMGGAISRLSKRVQSAYESDPIVGAILDLSEHRPPRSPGGPCTSSLACSVRYVVIDSSRASGELVDATRRFFDLRAIADDKSRSLYRADVAAPCTCSAGSSSPDRIQ